MFEKKTRARLVNWSAVRKLSEIGCNQDSTEISQLQEVWFQVS